MSDYDKYGHCILCGKNMLIEAVVGGKVVMRLTAEYDEVEVLLNNFSKMRVCTCKGCKSSMTPDKYEVVMSKVQKGWKKEVDNLPWSDEKKKNHLDACDKLSIVTNAEGKADDALLKEFKEHKEKK